MDKLLEKIKTIDRDRKGLPLINSNVDANHLGFTLIELLIVIAIIGILVGIVVVAINPARLVGEANDSARRQELAQVKNSLQLYFNDFNSYPGALTDLQTVYMRNIPDFTVSYSTSAAGIPSGEYRAATILQYPDTPLNDDNTKTKCNPVPTGVGWDDADYFICPD